MLKLLNYRFAGIGSRETPEDIMDLMFEECAYLCLHGATLHSGGADGADTACENGAKSINGKMKIFLPWKNFNKNTSPLYNVSKRAMQFASQYHPAWCNLSRGAQLLMGRNCYQVLDEDLDEPVDFILCWTKDGEATGGTGQALRIAEKYKITVYNLFKVAQEELPWRKI